MNESRQTWTGHSHVTYERVRSQQDDTQLRRTSQSKSPRCWQKWAASWHVTYECVMSHANESCHVKSSHITTGRHPNGAGRVRANLRSASASKQRHDMSQSGAHKVRRRAPFVEHRVAGATKKKNDVLRTSSPNSGTLALYSGKRALYSGKRALYSGKRALYSGPKSAIFWAKSPIF